MKLTTKIWLFTAIILLVFVIFMFILGSYNASIKAVLWYWIIGAVVLGGIVIGVFIYLENKDKTPKSTNQPIAITMDEARKLALQELAIKQFDELDMGVEPQEGTEDAGSPSSSIYYIKGPGILNKKNNYVIGINMNYPEIKRAILINPKDSDFNRMIQRLPTSPKEEIKPRTSIVNNPATGIQVITEEGTEKKESTTEKEKDPIDK